MKRRNLRKRLPFLAERSYGFGFIDGLAPSPVSLYKGNELLAFLRRRREAEMRKAKGR